MPSRPSSFRLRLFRLWSCLLLAALMLLPATLEAAPARNETPRQRLEEAVNAYKHGGYREAAAQLTNLLYPLKLTDRSEIVRAKVYLGLSLYLLGRKPEAEQEFRGVFKINPNYKPDPLFIPQEIVVFIEQFRPPPPVTPRATPVPGLGEKVVAPDIAAPPFPGANLLPLGIPQFMHREYGRGALFAGAELSLLALNLGSYWMLNTYNSNNLTESQYRQLIAAKVVNISSFSLLALTVVVGAGDAVYRYRKPPAPVSLRLDVTPGARPGLAFDLQGRF